MVTEAERIKQLETLLDGLSTYIRHDEDCLGSTSCTCSLIDIIKQYEPFMPEALMLGLLEEADANTQL